MPEFRKIVQGSKNAVQGKSVRDEKIKSPEIVYENTLKYVENAYTLLAKGKDVPSPKSILSEFIYTLKTQGPEMVVLAHRPPSFVFPFVHAVEVSIIALCIGVLRRLTESSIEELGSASLFHCFGRSLESEEDLLREKDKFAEIKEKYIKSVEKLDLVSGMIPKIKKILREHHQRIGREDWPTEKIEGDMEFETQILIVADAYCTMIHSLNTKSSIHPHTALIRLLERGGFPLNVDILKTLIEIVGIYPVGTYVELNNGEIGRVVRPRFGFPMRPLVEVLFSSTGGSLPQPLTRDLVETPVIHIRKIVEEKKEKQ